MSIIAVTVIALLRSSVSIIFSEFWQRLFSWRLSPSLPDLASKND
ncbi:hypothetical protein RUM4293_01604 [Ruegeria atlantica]|uniref:Uncharacterized protein n=1 Tax=Ruegeria atlantica TaxID=81569 RepID=A0A0P1ELT3_9RHOB|nr:hypothetical protein RUM4293_01604 [Ruegeria atlantica]